MSEMMGYNIMSWDIALNSTETMFFFGTLHNILFEKDYRTTPIWMKETGWNRKPSKESWTKMLRSEHVGWWEVRFQVDACREEVECLPQCSLRKSNKVQCGWTFKWEIIFKFSNVIFRGNVYQTRNWAKLGMIYLLPNGARPSPGCFLFHKPEVRKQIVQYWDAPSLADHGFRCVEFWELWTWKACRVHPNCKKWSTQMDPNKEHASGLERPDTKRSL